MTYSLNSLQRIRRGSILGAIKRDVRSLDYSSCGIVIPNDAELTGKEHGTRNRNWGYVVVYRDEGGLYSGSQRLGCPRVGPTLGCPHICLS